MKTSIYNLIILDESGSMSGVRQQTISGCNEKINTIVSAQEKYKDTQEHFVSIYAFQDNDKCPSRYLIKNQPATEVGHINEELYKPWGATPLYDAVGSTLADLKAVTKDEEMAVGNVTIITDGMENASCHYSYAKVLQMIDALKEMGWTFNLIGANFDVEATASAMHIDNSLTFEQNAVGTQAMFETERSSRQQWFAKISESLKDEDGDGSDKKDLRTRFKEAARNYFKKKITDN